MRVETDYKSLARQLKHGNVVQIAAGNQAEVDRIRKGLLNRGMLSIQGGPIIEGKTLLVRPTRRGVGTYTESVLADF